MKTLKYNLLLVLAALIWGASFVAQSVGVELIGPFTFNGIRFVIGGIVLLPVIFFIDKKKTVSKKPVSGFKDNLKAGLICGCVLCAASSFQTIGIVYTTAGKSGFITALYVILVPIFGLLLGRRSRFSLWISAVLAVIGMYLLCVNEGLGINKGDALTLICAVLFAVHILVIDKYAPGRDGVKISSLQFLVAGVISLIIAAFTEEIIREQILLCTVPILYAGVFSCGIAYTLQIIGQQKTHPAVASLLLSLESVFSVISAWLILGEALSLREIIGCITVFASIILAELTGSKE